jgi:hypothetical protein
MPEFVPVPTVADLVRRGLADLLVGDKSGKVTLAHLSAKGQAAISDAQIENGRRWRAYDEQRREELVAGESAGDPWPEWK